MGHISTFHVGGIQGIPHLAKLKAICDTNSAALDNFTDPGVDKYTDYHELLKDSSIESVLVAVPNFLHMQVCHDAAVAGKHILVEKPLALTPEEADKIIAAAETSEITLMVGHGDRYSPVFRKVKDLLEENALGEIFALHIEHYSNYNNPPGGWRRSKELIGGGCVMDTGIHQLDLLNWYMGKPKEVFAYAVIDERRLDAEVAAMAVFKYANQAIADFFCNWGVYHRPLQRIRFQEGLSVFGKDGTLYVMDDQTLALSYRVEEGDPQIEEVKVGQLAFHAPYMWEHFIDCVRTGKTPLTNGYESRIAVELVHAIYQSIETGAPVPLPLQV